MYIQNIFIENMGAIENFKLTDSQLFTETGLPKPIILVGKNGTGKTTVLSSIVDALYELSSGLFSDTLPKVAIGHKFFKISSNNNVNVNKPFGFSYLKFIDIENKKTYQYLDKLGNISFDSLKSKTNNIFDMPASSYKTEQFKYTTDTRSDTNLKNKFLKNSYCYFPSDRYEMPHWLNLEFTDQSEQFNDNIRFDDKLGKDILVRRALDSVKNWILDVFLDSRANLIVNYENNSLEFLNDHDANNYIVLRRSIENIEKILSKVIQKDIFINLSLRGSPISRISLLEKASKKLLIPSLNNLSAGQSTLLGIFCTIIQYADNYDANKSIYLEDIEGIVLIDEVDLHLHIELQYEVLPSLIKLFPKIQFIITTHSPFLLAGMAKAFSDSDNKILILNMPSGTELTNIDDFEEFNKAYHLFGCMTEDYKRQLESLKEKLSESNKPLIITEGKTDWKHLKAAKKALHESISLDIEFLEFENELQMGSDALDKMLNHISNIPNSRKIIGIFDRDEPKILNKYTNADTEFESLGNSVYAFCIPRVNEQDDAISIEHYYSTDNLKTLDENERRLFLGTEFYDSGNSCDGQFQTTMKNKTGKIAIIDSGVFKSTDLNHEQSVALTKNDFANNVLNETNRFDNFDFSNFELIFDVIRNILNQEYIA